MWAIQDVSRTVSNMVEHLDNRLAEGRMERLEENVQAIRKDELIDKSRFVFELVRNEDRDTVFPLGGSRYSVPEGLSPEETAERRGLRAGVNDLLLALVPDDVTSSADSPLIRSMYFRIPWSKDLLQLASQRNPELRFTEYEDGSLLWQRPTRIPGLIVSYEYPPGSNYPERTIRYCDTTLE